MKRATFTILFFIKKSKLLKDETAPIYMGVTEMENVQKFLSKGV